MLLPGCGPGYSAVRGRLTSVMWAGVDGRQRRSALHALGAYLVMGQVSPRLRQVRQAMSSAYKKNHLARNSIWVILGTGMNAALGLAFWAEATHSHSTSVIGQASAVIAAMTFASTVAMVGLGTTVVQVLPTADDDTWSTAVNALVIGGSVVGLLVGIVTAIILPHLSSNLAFTSGPATAACISLGVAALTLATLLDYVFTAERATHYIAVRGFTFGLLKLAVLALLIKIGLDSASFLVGAWVVGSILTSGITLSWQLSQLGRQHRFGLNGVARYLRKWFRVLFLHHLTSLGGIMIPSLMPVLVVSRLSKADSAYFYVAWLVSGILLTVSSAIAGNLLADLSYGDDALESKLRRAWHLIGALMLPPMLVIAVFGRAILNVFGPAYAAHSYGILLIFVIVAIPDAITNVYVTVLRVRHYPERAAAMNIGMAFIALGGGWWLMGVFGLMGAAWAWALSQASGCCYAAIDPRLGGKRRPGGPGTR